LLKRESSIRMVRGTMRDKNWDEVDVRLVFERLQVGWDAATSREVFVRAMAGLEGRERREREGVTRTAERVGRAAGAGA
jgi:hypothetical protein